MSLRVQKITKIYPDSLAVAIKYYSIICILNDIFITEREIQLLAFTCIVGTISYKTAKEEFAETFGSSVASVNNMISKLKSLGLLVKQQGKYRINPKISLDFEKVDIGLVVTLKKSHVPAPGNNTKGQS